MSAAQLISELAALGVELTVDGEKLKVNAPKGAITPALAGQIRQHKSAILSYLSDARREEDSELMPPLRRRGQTGPAPLSFAQQRLWYVDQLDPGNAIYNLPAAFQLTGELDVAVLEQAVNDIVARHECLRTTFAMVDDQPVQRVVPELRLELRTLDFRDKGEEAFADFCNAEAARPFDLGRGPMLRPWLIRLADDRHVLFFVVEHAVFDGGSFDIFMRELVHCYEARLEGREPDLPALPVTYGDYAQWQREWIQGDVLERQLAYWRQQLSGELPVLELPTDRPRPPQQDYRSARQSLSLTKDELRRVSEFAHQQNATIFMVMLAAFKLLLYRYTGQRDLIVGAPIQGRVRPELEGVMGFFVNTLVLRTALDPHASFGDLLGRVKSVCFDGFAHQNTPFELLVEDLKPARDLSRSPIVQATFMYQDVSRRARSMGGVAIDQIIIDHPAVPTDINFWVRETPEGMDGGLEYATALFDGVTMARFIEHYKRLLLAAVANPGQRVCEIPMLAPAEVEQLLKVWNDTAAPYPRTSPLHQLVEEQAQRTPDKIACRFLDESLSYAELDERANQLANYLLGKGVKGGLVGICLEPSLDMLAGLLGILKSGAAYLPLDPSFPLERLALMLEDAAPALVITQKSLLERLPREIVPIVCLDSEKAELGAAPSSSPAVAVSSEQLAYVIYTSGSTGRPKGVELPHYAVVNFLTAMRQRPGFSGDDVLLAVTTISFDISVLELFLPLVCGGSVVIAANEAAGDGYQLGRLIEQHGVTVMQATPATWYLLNGAGWQGSLNFKVLTGGEALPVELAAELFDKAESVWNMYGPTEATVWSTCYRLTGAHEPVLIGRPIANTRLYVLDADQQLLPVGVPGELYIGGDGVARGYRDRPELTAERFLDDPFVEDGGARIYRTGDLVRYLPDGNLEYLRRLDNQVKVRGYRIELGDIEAALGAHEAVCRVVADVREEGMGDKRIIAYVVYQPGEQATVSELRKYLRDLLPGYMVPNLFVELEELPQTLNGKVDRKALPNPFGRVAESVAAAPPETPTERTLAQLWQSLLGIESVGRYDNFFDLGGHSLLSMQAIAQFRRQTGLEIEARAILLDTLAQIAAQCDRQEGGAAAEASQAESPPADPFGRVLKKLGTIFRRGG